MSVPSGATLVVLSSQSTGESQRVKFYMSGTYTAADFTLDYSDGLGFSPKWGRVSNLTDRTSTEGTDQHASGLKIVAAGTRNYAAHGITFGDRKATIDVSVAGPITDNDVVQLEFEA